MKRLLAILCTLAIVFSVAPTAVFAAENSSLQAAMDDDSFEIIVLEEDTSNLTVNRDTTIDLNGHNIDGVSVQAGTLYLLDSQTADYTVADGVYGQVTNVTGNVKAAEGYLQVGNSFHAVNLDIYAMTLRAADVGVYYKSNFAADEIVAAEVESFGVALSVVTAPNAENLDTYCGYSVFTGFEAGKGANATGTSTLLKGIMKPSNGDGKNAKNAAMPIYGRAYIKTSEGYYFGETVKRSLREQVEAIDKAWISLKAAQKAPVLSMLEDFTSVMENWSIPNILGPQPLIESEEFIYGSYFDHDRFPGNTGTRLTSGDYSKIRSADALLPAQEITIRVKDTDLSNYKVTLGYYTKDGVYTGRTGILPMTDGELTITAGEMRGAYFRVNVYIYNGRFTKVPETALILVYGEKAPIPEQPDEPEQPTDPEQPDTPTDPSRPWEGKKIAVVGDSISTGSYPGTVANLTGASLQNLSVSGSKLSGTGAKSLVSLVKGVAADADLVIVFGGTNDYWHKGTRIGAADSTDPNTYVGGLRTILSYLKENNPNAKYLFVFPADQTFGGNSSNTDFGYGTLQDFRSAFLQFCEANHVPYVDIGATEFDSAKHSGDGVHPNSAGHAIIAEAIYERISAGLQTVTRQVRLLPEAVTQLPEGALASAPGVVFNTAPYAYLDKQLYAGKHITKIGIPVKTVKALDENQTFTLSVVKTTSDTYQYVSQTVLKLPKDQLGDFTTVNKWIYLDVDLQLQADETLAFGMPTDTVSWGYASAKKDPYTFRSATTNWQRAESASILFDVYATETIEFTNTEHGLAAVTKAQVLPGVLGVFPESAIATGNDVEFTNPPYAYADQTLFAGKRITKIGIPVKRVAALDDAQLFTLSVIKQGSGAYQYVKEYPLYIPTEGLDGTTVNQWVYLDVDIQVAADETLAFGGKNDTVIWAWKSGLGGNTYKFRDAKGGTTTGIFFDIYAESVLTYEDYQKQLQEEQERLEAEQEEKRLDAALQKVLSGKGISILGDSISTFQGWSNNTSYNSTIGSNAVYYNGSRDGFAAVNETWWLQTVNRSGLELVVNNSWSGDQVTIHGISRSLQLHNNAGKNPDIIAVYLGINDFRNRVTADTFRVKYDEMIAGMMEKYEGADVYLFTLLYTTNVSSCVDPVDVVAFNEVIEETAAKYGCTLVDLYNDTGITSENLATYMGDRVLHPNYAGMDRITQCFIEALRRNYKIA